MASLLLALIYVAFVSLGLPDSLLGAGWPVMHTALAVPVGAAGIVSTLITASTIVSSLASSRLTRRLGVGGVLSLSVLTTALALFGFSWSTRFWVLCLWAIPYGLGAGSVDAALNNYVALYYSSRVMNWLHSCWGVGASISPFIMSYALAHQLHWNGGYRLVGILQLGLFVVLLFSLPLWRQKAQETAHQTPAKMLSLKQVLRLRGVSMMMLAFAGYCSMESLSMLWAASFLHASRGAGVAVAAMFASMFAIGIMGGRFAAGFIADILGDRKMILVGASVALLGILLLWLPVAHYQVAAVGLVIMGLGCAPIYPAIIHQTPANFGAVQSQAVIGVQMAAAYSGAALMPPLFGALSEAIGMQWLPVVQLILWALMLGSYLRMQQVLAA